MLIYIYMLFIFSTHVLIDILVSYTCCSIEQHALKNVNCFWDNKITFYLESSGGQSAYLYLSVVHFFNTCVNQHLWQFKTVFSCIGV